MDEELTPQEDELMDAINEIMYRNRELFAYWEDVMWREQVSD